MEHRLQHFTDIAVFLQEGLRHVINESGRRIIGDEAHRQLGGYKLRRGRMARQLKFI